LPAACSLQCAIFCCCGVLAAAEADGAVDTPLPCYPKSGSYPAPANPTRRAEWVTEGAMRSLT
jgi:hypothetical protein